MKQIVKIILLTMLIMSTLIKHVYADDFSLERQKYNDVYAVYDGPDRIHLYEAERYIIDGKTAYCIEPGAPIHSTWYQGTEDLSITGLDSTTIEDIKLIAYYGYNYKNTQNTMNYYLATQELIWKRIANRDVYWIVGTDRNGPKIDLSSEIARINERIENHKKLPSFNGQTYTMRANDEATIWDSNYVLSNYHIYETDVSNVSIDGPYLKMKATSPHETGSVKFIRESDITNPVIIYFSGENQKLLTVGALTPIYAELKTEVLVYPKIKVNKINSETKKNIKIPGIKFKIKNLKSGSYACYPKDICEFVTDENGVMMTKFELSYGTYQLEEVPGQNIDGYLWNSEPLKFEVNEDSDYKYSGKEAYLEFNFENKPVKGKLVIDKVGEEMTIVDDTITYHKIALDGVSFELYYGTNLIDSFTTSNGQYTIDNLKLGSYCLKEVSTVLNHEVLKEPYCFELKYKNDTTPIVTKEVTLENKIPKGTFILTKLALETNKPLSGAKIDIYDENDNLLLSRITDEEGKVTINDLPKGKYYYLEVNAPEGYLLNDEKNYFEIHEDGEVIKAHFINEKIKVPDTKKSSYKFLKTIGKLLLKILMVLYAS